RPHRSVGGPLPGRKCPRSPRVREAALELVRERRTVAFVELSGDRGRTWGGRHPSSGGRELGDKSLCVGFGQRGPSGRSERVRLPVARDDVEVDVEDHLAGPRSRVQGEVVVRGEAFGAPAELVQGSDERHLVVPGEVREARSVPLRDHEQMTPRERKDVQEGERRGVLVDDVGGGPPLHDVAENAAPSSFARCVGHRPPRFRGGLKGYRTRSHDDLIRGRCLGSLDALADSDPRHFALDHHDVEPSRRGGGGPHTGASARTGRRSPDDRRTSSAGLRVGPDPSGRHSGFSHADARQPSLERTGPVPDPGRGSDLRFLPAFPILPRIRQRLRAAQHECRAGGGSSPRSGREGHRGRTRPLLHFPCPPGSVRRPTSGGSADLLRVRRPDPPYPAVGGVSLPPLWEGLVTGIGGLSDSATAALAQSSRSPDLALRAGSDDGALFVHDNTSGEDWFVGSDYTQAYGATELFPGAHSVPNATYPRSVAIATLLGSAYNLTTQTDLPPWDPAVIDDYFNGTLNPTWPMPNVTGVPVSVNGVTPPLPGSFGSQNDSTLYEVENSLDLEMAGSLAPGSSLYNFYFAGSLLQGTATVGDAANYIADDLAQALAHNYGTAHLAVVSCSFGLPDLNNSAWNAELLTAAGTG